MVCVPCQQRRQMGADAYKQQGVVGVVKAAPKIVKHVIENRPSWAEVRIFRHLRKSP